MCITVIKQIISLSTRSHYFITTGETTFLSYDVYDSYMSVRSPCLSDTPYIYVIISLVLPSTCRLQARYNERSKERSNSIEIRVKKDPNSIEINITKC